MSGSSESPARGKTLPERKVPVGCEGKDGCAVCGKMKVCCGFHFKMAVEGGLKVNKQVRNFAIARGYHIPGDGKKLAVCFHCGQPGHKAKDCKSDAPKPESGRPERLREKKRGMTPRAVADRSRARAEIDRSLKEKILKEGEIPPGPNGQSNSVVDEPARSSGPTGSDSEPPPPYESDNDSDGSSSGDRELVVPRLGCKHGGVPSTALLNNAAAAESLEFETTSYQVICPLHSNPIFRAVVSHVSLSIGGINLRMLPVSECFWLDTPAASDLWKLAGYPAGVTTADVFFDGTHRGFPKDLYPTTVNHLHQVSNAIRCNTPGFSPPPSTGTPVPPVIEFTEEIPDLSYGSLRISPMSRLFCALGELLLWRQPSWLRMFVRLLQVAFFIMGVEFVFSSGMTAVIVGVCMLVTASWRASYRAPTYLHTVRCLSGGLRTLPITNLDARPAVLQFGPVKQQPQIGYFEHLINIRYLPYKRRDVYEAFTFMSLAFIACLLFTSIVIICWPFGYRSSYESNLVSYCSLNAGGVPSSPLEYSDCLERSLRVAREKGWLPLYRQQHWSDLGWTEISSYAETPLNSSLYKFGCTSVLIVLVLTRWLKGWRTAIIPFNPRKHPHSDLTTMVGQPFAVDVASIRSANSTRIFSTSLGAKAVKTAMTAYLQSATHINVDRHDDALTEIVSGTVEYAAFRQAGLRAVQKGARIPANF